MMMMCAAAPVLTVMAVDHTVFPTAGHHEACPCQAVNSSGVPWDGPHLQGVSVHLLALDSAGERFF